MHRATATSLLLTVLSLAVGAAAQTAFSRKVRLTDRYCCDGVETGAVNGDGLTDVLSSFRLGTFVFLSSSTE